MIRIPDYPQPKPLEGVHPVEDWLGTLPEPWRSQALANKVACDRRNRPALRARTCRCLSMAIDLAFIWHGTPQGYDYWRHVYDKAWDEEQGP